MFSRKLSLFLLLTLIVTGAVYIFAAPHENSKAMDYSDQNNWLAVPVSADSDTDIFFLCPTTYHKQDENAPDICDIDDSLMRSGAQLAYRLQATAFETVGNIYAPYYRQGDAETCLSLPAADRDALLGGSPKEDVLAAFDYYIRYFNHGRPFILAGLSQGSNLLLFLLSDYMKAHPDVYRRMVAAYVIGYSVTESYLAENPHLKFAENADDTGVIIAYNTQAPVVEGGNPLVLEGALVINPITWTRDETPAGAEENLGSFLPDSGGYIKIDENTEFKKILNFADARVDLEKGALVCSTVSADDWASGSLEKGIYHSYDYAFYYYNIRENALNRAMKFQKLVR